MDRRNNIFSPLSNYFLVLPADTSHTADMYCKYCEREQPDNLFRKHSRKCKPCQATATNRWRANNPKKAKESRLHYLATHKEHTREYNREWLKHNTPWRDRNKPKRNASALLQYAVKVGKVKKPKTCSRCKREAYVVGHHHDYLKPLEVEWICQSCHRHEHVKNPVEQQPAA